MQSVPLKCNQKSNKFLINASELKALKKYSEALVELNKSLCYATSDDQLGLIFAVRAVVFFEIQRYGKCHENIKLAKTHGYKGDALLIENECIEKLSEEKSEEDPWNFFKISLPTNKKIPFIADCLKLNETWKYGRYIVTDKALKTGEVVIIEEPLFKMPNKDVRYKRCANCMKSNVMSLLPCTQQTCVSTMYCSKECMKIGWKRFHRFECGHLEDSLENNEYDLMIQRIIFESIDMCDGSVETLKTVLGGVKSSQSIYDFDVSMNDEKERDRNRLKAVYALKKAVTSEEDRLMAEWFLDNDQTIKALCKTKEQKDFLRTFILKIMGIIDRNSYLFYCLPSTNATKDVEIGSGIFSYASLLNHSCSPNLFRFFVDNKQVYVTKKPIEAGQQLFVGYLSNFTLCDRDKRQINLQQDFQFKCSCDACVNDYPLMKNLKKYDKCFVDPPTLIGDDVFLTVMKIYNDNCEYIENNIKKFPFPSYEICSTMQSSFRLLHYLANKFYLPD